MANREIDIQKIDPNFKKNQAFNMEDFTFYDIKDNLWSLYGLIADDVFRRLPKNIAYKTNDGVAALHMNTAGGRVRFTTDSPYIAIIAKMPDIVQMPHMPQTGISGFDLYTDDKFTAIYTPGIEDGILRGVSYIGEGDAKTITINFPLYNNVTDLYIGITKGYSFDEAPKYQTQKKLLFYGSSITQGGCVSRPGLAYPSQVARAVKCDHINLGFSGNARGEIVMADYIAKIAPDIFIMDYDHNAPSVQHLKETHEAFFKYFRKAQKETPVIFMSAPNIKFCGHDWEERRDIIKLTYDNAKANGDENVYFIDGETLWNEEHWDSCTMDKCHPNDLGHFEMAQKVIEVLKQLV